VIKYLVIPKGEIIQNDDFEFLEGSTHRNLLTHYCFLIITDSLTSSSLIKNQLIMP
jgi:hypothetical protein